MDLLRVENLNKAFGGLLATNNVSFSVKQGELASIIGPNGAGKTTIFNQITGRFSPDSGQIIFDGASIMGLRPYDIVRRGIGRSFQRSNVFPRLTVYENVQTAVISYFRASQNVWRPTTRLLKFRERTDHILKRVGLYDKRRRFSGKLALGDQKRLEIGLGLALEPKLLLLDEPTAGMSPEETRDTVALIEQIAHEFKVTLLFTEHDMAVVFGISQRIHVLHQGSIIASGTPHEISKNPEVQRIYLGDEKKGSRFRRKRAH